MPVAYFSKRPARAVAAGDAIAELDLVDCVAGLVTKSLVAAEAGRTVLRYRLLETTRAYLLEKLAESGELQAVARRHAIYYRDLFEGAEAEWDTRPTRARMREWLLSALNGHSAKTGEWSATHRQQTLSAMPVAFVRHF